MRTITKKTISAAVVASLVGLSSAAHAFTACQVTDIGGVDDKGFNATAWKGVQDAVAKHGIDSKLLESKSETPFNINFRKALLLRLYSVNIINVGLF